MDSIRTVLEDYIKRKGITNSQFAIQAGVNPGTISAIISRSRPIAMRQLDLITAGMELEAGSLYDLYIDEFFVDATPNWRRLHPLLYRCAELNKLECIRRVLEYVMDVLVYVPMLFDTAEDFYKKGYKEASALLYESVAESEKYQHSERLAVCKYRLFSLSIKDDQKANLRAALHFEPYINRLQDEEQLDALLDLMNMYASLEEYDKVIELSHVVLERVNSPYFVRTGKGRRVFIAYESYPYLMIAGSYGRMGNYREAIRYTKMYADMEFSEPRTPEEHAFVRQMRAMGISNTLSLRFSMGETDVLPEFVQVLLNRDYDPFSSIYSIVKAANEQNLDIDHVLFQFEDRIQSYLMGKGEEINRNQVGKDRFVKWLREMAIYHTRLGRKELGMECMQMSLDAASRINSIGPSNNMYLQKFLNALLIK